MTIALGEEGKQGRELGNWQSNTHDNTVKFNPWWHGIA